MSDGKKTEEGERVLDSAGYKKTSLCEGSSYLICKEIKFSTVCQLKGN